MLAIVKILGSYILLTVSPCERLCQQARLWNNSSNTDHHSNDDDGDEKQSQTRGQRMLDEYEKYVLGTGAENDNRQAIDWVDHYM